MRTWYQILVSSLQQIFINFLPHWFTAVNRKQSTAGALPVQFTAFIDATIQTVFLFSPKFVLGNPKPQEERSVPHNYSLHQTQTCNCKNVILPSIQRIFLVRIMNSEFLHPYNICRIITKFYYLFLYLQS